MVEGVVRYRGRWRVLRIQRITRSHRYKDEVLQPVVLPFGDVHVCYTCTTTLDRTSRVHHRRLWKSTVYECVHSQLVVRIWIRSNIFGILSVGVFNDIRLPLLTLTSYGGELKRHRWSSLSLPYNHLSKPFIALYFIYFPKCFSFLYYFFLISHSIYLVIIHLIILHLRFPYFANRGPYNNPRKYVTYFAFIYFFFSVHSLYFFLFSHILFCF